MTNLIPAPQFFRFDNRRVRMDGLRFGQGNHEHFVSSRDYGVGGRFLSSALANKEKWYPIKRYCDIGSS